jgi:hypothetical protein
MNGPCKYCLDKNRYALIRKLPGGEYCYCANCSRHYVMAKIEIDAMCIEQISQLLWKEMDHDPGELNEPELYILNHKPYFASTSDLPDSFIEINT